MPVQLASLQCVFCFNTYMDFLIFQREKEKASLEAVQKWSKRGSFRHQRNMKLQPPISQSHEVRFVVQVFICCCLLGFGGCEYFNAIFW